MKSCLPDPEPEIVNFDIRVLVQILINRLGGMVILTEQELVETDLEPLWTEWGEQTNSWVVTTKSEMHKWT